jgi:hypothetical protein
MRLQRSTSRRVAGKEYIKFQVVIPNDAVAQLRWRQGDHLEGRPTRTGFLIYKAEAKESITQPDYETFKKEVVRALLALPQGATWSEFRAKTALKQGTPSPIYVKRMEDEGILERHRDAVTSQVIWKPSKGILGSASILNGWTDRNPNGDSHK